MLMKLIVVGKIREKGLLERCEEYRKRLGAYGKFEAVELPDSSVEGEGASILRELEKERSAAVIVLSEEGKEFTSVAFSQYLQHLDRKVVLVIGGPFGLAPAVKQRADLLWSLSKLTFPHEIARLLCMEQLYRACNIARGGSYHHV